MRLPALSALRAFEAAGRHLSFTKAAAELHVTQTAISHQIKALEADLGVRLFVRRPRALALTEAGQAYLGSLSEAFRMIQRASDRARARVGEDTVTVSVLPSFAAKWLVPRLAHFRERHPTIDVRISADYQNVDFQRRDVDLAVRFGRGAWPGVRVEPLMAEMTVPVCSPALARADPPLRTLSDLRYHTLLHDDWFGDRHGHWRQWLAAMGVTDIDYQRGPTFTDSSHVIQAAIAGQGVALGRSVLIADDLAAGRLVCPIPEAERPSLAYYVVSAEGGSDTPPVAAFRAWLHAEAKLGTSDAENKAGPASRPREGSREGENATSRRGMNLNHGVPPAL
jgi:LysR family glycine cleavage system transcriptional activator